MANSDVVVGATGSYVVLIDSDDDSTAQDFAIRHGAGGTLLFSVGENGDIVLGNGTGVLAFSSCCPATFSNGITVTGFGDFTNAGTSTKVSTAPGPNDGVNGELRLVEDSGNAYIYGKIAGGWKRAKLL